MPLGALDTVSFDIETTGLDPKHDRVIECAAVRVCLGQVCEQDIFQSLVNPGVPIPARSTSIHGITDRDVAEAVGFRSMIHDFARWSGPSVFIGYGIDFDLAVLSEEHQRFGMLWAPCQTLDILPLIPFANLNLKNFGLATVAKELGIATTGRHRALADAMMTARVFTALIPLWKKAGIITLAEAQHAKVRNPKLRNHRLALESVPTIGDGMNSFPYRQRVRDVMTSPPAEVPAEMSMVASITTMTDRNISSLIVRYPNNAEPRMITARDMLAAIAQNGEAALAKPVGEFCSRHLLTITDREFVYRSVVEMNNNSVRHLGVVNENDELVGVITASDLMWQQGKDAIFLGGGIQSAQSSPELARIWSDLSTVVKALVRQSIDARNISAIVSRELRAMTKRACELCEQEIGSPPCDYAMLVLGSGGRGESLLAMDQDNAIVMADDQSDQDANHYFATLGARASKILDEAGIRLCDGDIMASNPNWRKTRQEWHNTVREWLTQTSNSNILNADIFFDQMCVHGNSNLATEVYHTALADARKSKPFLTLLATHACEFNLPFGMFGRWRTDDRGRIDLKKNGIMPIFSAARAVALEYGIPHRSTLRRLTEFKSCRSEIAGVCDDLTTAHGIILGTILKQQLHDIEHGIPLSNRVSPSHLSRLETQQLKWALGRVPQVTTLLGVPTV